MFSFCCLAMLVALLVKQQPTVFLWVVNCCRGCYASLVQESWRIGFCHSDVLCKDFSIKKRILSKKKFNRK
jgi:hypothetical protein